MEGGCVSPQKGRSLLTCSVQTHLAGGSITCYQVLVPGVTRVSCPVAHFAALFTLLGLYNVTFDPTLAGVVSIVLISLGSFFSFGYFRIYEAVIHRYPEVFISDDERRDHKVKIHPHFRAHFIPGILYMISVHPSAK